MKVGAIYFVLYIVLITELLVVITERDDAQRKLSNQVAALDNLNIEKHELPLKVSIPQDTATYLLPNNWTKDIFTSVIIIPENLVSQSEKDSVVFHIDIDQNSPIPPFWPKGGLDSKINKRVSFFENNIPVTKYEIFKNGKYCKFSVNIRLKDITNSTNGQIGYLSQNKLKYKFNVYITTPRMISNEFNAKSQKNILNGLSDFAKIKYLRSLPDSSEIKDIRKFLSKERLTKRDTIQFLKSLPDSTSINNTRKFLIDFRKYLLKGN